MKPAEFYRGQCGQSSNYLFRRLFVDLSRLLVERWMKTENGKKFDTDLEDLSIPNPQERLRIALENQGIPLPDWITPNPLSDSYNGSFICDESQPGLAFFFNIPLQDRPQSITDSLLQGWIDTCNQWVDEGKYEDPDEDFPVTPSIYIPLATC